MIGAGVTLHEALKAYETLSQEGIKIRVVDIYSVKPLDKDGLELNAKQAGGKVITVEDHYIQGGIFEAVNGQLASKGVSVYGLAVTEIPRSGLPEELLEVFGISANHIVRKVKELLA